MSELLIGNCLRKMRFLRAEITQAKLADMVGVTRQTIVALETGRYAPSLELAMKLATVFDCSVDELFFWKDVEQAKTNYHFEGKNDG